MVYRKREAEFEELKDRLAAFVHMFASKDSEINHLKGKLSVKETEVS